MNSKRKSASSWELIGVDPRIRKINMYGDSFGTLGSYPNTNTAIVGTVADGTSTTWVTTTSVSRRNAGHFYTLHRQLAKSNIGVPYLNHWAEGGSGVVQTNGGGNKLDSRLDASLVDPYQPPNIAVILIGANDLDTQLASEANADAWEAAYKVELDKLINAGVELIIINDLFSKVKNAVGTPTDYSTNIARGNVRVANIAADPSYLPYVKAIAVSDWSVATPDSLNADGVHPSPLGFNYIGKRIAEKILAFL